MLYSMFCIDLGFGISCLGFSILPQGHLHGVVDRALDFDARGHWFDPWLKLTAFTGK